MEDASRHNPALRELEVLVGEWDMELSRASFLPTLDDKAHGHIGFEWIEGGAFIVMRQCRQRGSPPAARWVIGRDESSPEYRALYSDERGVSRIYEMTFTNGTWRLWRNTTDFSQRFEGVISDDRRVITAHWEKAVAGGEWEHDFDVTYTRAR